MVSFWHIVLSALVVLLTWMFNKVKTIYNRLNKKNTKIPNITVLRKIVPHSQETGWKVSVVQNGVPMWKYQTTFTFAPCNLYSCASLIMANREKIMGELLNMKTFCSLFPNFSPLKLEKNVKDGVKEGDILSISNINTSLSLTSIITSHHSIFTLQRFWLKDENSFWMYMYPTSSLLSGTYGYWIAFHVQDMVKFQGCYLHILASFPPSTSFSDSSQMLTSCLVMVREHMAGLLISEEKQRSNTRSQKTLRETVSPTTTRKSNKKSTKQHQQQSELPKPIVSTNASTTPLTANEVFVQEEEPAQINHHIPPDFNDELEKSLDAAGDRVKALLEQSKAFKKTIDEMHLEPEPVVHQEISPSSRFEYDPELEPYKESLGEGYKMLMEIFLADLETPGWLNLGVKNGVHIMKKDGDEVSASGTYKGSCTINVPLPYLLDYTHNLEYRNEFDALFESGYDLKVFNDGVTKVNNLLYQNVWPTTGRDFCNITALRHIKENLYGSVVRAIEHPECPHRKNKVRGEIIIAGYVFKELSVDPPSVLLTYITRAELKGSIPQRVINRVNADQPLIAGHIKDNVERRFKMQDPDTYSTDIVNKIRQIPSILEETNIKPTTEPNDNESIKIDSINNKDNISVEAPLEVQDGVNQPSLANESLQVTSTPQKEISVLQPERRNDDDENDSDSKYMLDNGFDMRKCHYTKPTEDGVVLPTRHLSNEHVLINDSESMSSLSQVEFTEDQTQVSISDHELDLPRDAFGNVDYITLGNQSAAALEEEFILARPVSATSHRTNDGPGVWSFQSVSKDIEILRKISPNQKFHSFLGRGIINALPVTVWEAIKNPTTRFVYDNMLKKTTVIKELTDRHRILHLRHETTACFLRQARDFCLLTVERVEQQKYTLVATSVESPECPPVRDCVRGRIFSSGWIVEPFVHYGKYCSKVTYIAQIDFGGKFPARIVNFIARRQPLCIAYLRDYLESAEI